MAAGASQTGPPRRRRNRGDWVVAFQFAVTPVGATRGRNPLGANGVSIVHPAGGFQLLPFDDGWNGEVHGLID